MGELLQPALVAAVISALVAAIGFWVNRSTVMHLHQQRLATDVALAEKRTAAEIDLAKKGFALDRSLAAWKRKVELAEEVLADFYKARDIIDAVRSPGAFGNEGETCMKEDWESEGDTSTLNAYYVAIERWNRERDFFAGLFARRYRFIALFGLDGAEAYDEVLRIRTKIFVAVRMLLDTHRHRELGSLPSDRKQWKEDIGWVLTGEDPIKAALDSAIKKIEDKCRPVIQETA
jgi:hypothetical protein